MSFMVPEQELFSAGTLKASFFSCDSEEGYRDKEEEAQGVALVSNFVSRISAQFHLKGHLSWFSDS